MQISLSRQRHSKKGMDRMDWTLITWLAVLTWAWFLLAANGTPAAALRQLSEGIVRMAAWQRIIVHTSHVRQKDTAPVANSEKPNDSRGQGRAPPFRLQGGDTPPCLSREACDASDRPTCGHSGDPRRMESSY
jgi:hypothetical protein